MVLVDDVKDNVSESASISASKSTSPSSKIFSDGPRKQHNIYKYTITSKQSERIDDALAYFIAVDMQPYSLVEKDGLRHFLQVVQPAYKLPSRKTLTDLKIPLLYSNTITYLKQQLKNVRFISCTTDA